MLHFMKKLFASDLPAQHADVAHLGPKNRQSGRAVETYDRAVEALTRNAALFDLAHDAILVRDRAGRILFWNQGAERLYGWSKSEALGRLTHDLLATRF